MQAVQPIRSDGPATHLKKAGTPTMGGLLIVSAMTFSTVLWADVADFYIILVLIVTVSYAVIGFMDDWRKQILRDPKGLPGRYKFFWELIVGIVVGVMLYFAPNYNTELSVPFLKALHPDLGWFYIPFAIFVIVGAANAVNLTDGLDGLAAGPVVAVAITYLVFAYCTGNVKIADYLLISYLPGTGELAVFCGAMVGAAMGFLWYNSYPAEIFMGDVGALSLGGGIGTVAVATKHELLLVIVGGLFVVETLSVIFQVGFFKWKQQTDLQDGAAPSSLRASGVARAEDNRAILDHINYPCPSGIEYFKNTIGRHIHGASLFPERKGGGSGGLPGLPRGIRAYQLRGRDGRRRCRRVGRRDRRAQDHPRLCPGALVRIDLSSGRQTRGINFDGFVVVGCVRDSKRISADEVYRVEVCLLRLESDRYNMMISEIEAM